MNTQPRSGRAHRSSSGCGAGYETYRSGTPASAVTCPSNACHTASTAGVTEYIRAFMIASAMRRLEAAKSGRLRHVAAEFPGAACDVGVDGFAHGWIERGRRGFRQQLLPDFGGASRRVASARLRPAFEIRPVGQQRTIESRLVARKRVRGAEEMPSRFDALDRVHREVVVAEVNGLQDLGPAAKQLGVDDDLFE